eukprot:11216563-Lingulodinium_polyedra.AAC.1
MFQKSRREPPRKFRPQKDVWEYVARGAQAYLASSGLDIYDVVQRAEGRDVDIIPYVCLTRMYTLATAR